jgi:hypothetical protein
MSRGSAAPPFENDAGQDAGDIGPGVDPDAMRQHDRRARRRMAVDDHFLERLPAIGEGVADPHEVMGSLTRQWNAGPRAGMAEEIIAGEAGHARRLEEFAMRGRQILQQRVARRRESRARLARARQHGADIDAIGCERRQSAMRAPVPQNLGVPQKIEQLLLMIAAQRHEGGRKPPARQTLITAAEPSSRST